MENLLQITDLSNIKGILNCGNKIFITDGKNELYTTDINEVKDYILENNYQFYEVIEYKPLSSETTEITYNDSYLRHLSNVMNSYHMGLPIRKFNNEESITFTKHDEKIPIWDFENYKYEINRK